MQHYALFRLTSGNALGWLSHTPRGAAMAFYSKVGGIKNAAL